MKFLIFLTIHLLLASVLLAGHIPYTKPYDRSIEEKMEALSGLERDLIFVDNNTLTIRMVPHTHDDVGWLKTMDQYYIDSLRSVSIQGVQYIMDTVVPALLLDKNKKFIYVEMAFFQRWWNEQNSNMQQSVKQLVQNGQLEFINGGYCMNDEGAVYYEDTIDQMTIGHQFILQNFGVTPQVAWHIDTFGHSSAQAALFAQMGFKAFYFARIDYQDFANRISNKGMEMIWIPNTSQGLENAMFTHVNYFHYSNPSGFCFDVLCNDDPIQDDPAIEGVNVGDRADAFVAWFRTMQQSYRTNELMHCAGDDFHFMAAQMNYKNWDKLFAYVNAHTSYNVNAIYSTPSEYLSAIYPYHIQYPTKTDDFLPYAHQLYSYWTGYFTSRPAFKGLMRREGRLLQNLKRIATQAAWDKSSAFIANNWAQVDAAILKLEQAMGITQHHDAATGTESQFVNEDYKLFLSNGEYAINQNFTFPFFQEKIQKDLGLSNAQLSTCLLNTSSVFCGVTYSNLNQGGKVLVTIYNSGGARQSVVRIKVPNGNVQVTNSAGTQLPTDVICANATDSTDCDLFFTDNFAGFAAAYYYLSHSTQSNQVAAQKFTAGQTLNVNSNQTITTTSLSSLAINYCTDSTKTHCYATQFNLGYSYYESDSAPNTQASNAWIFRPSDKTLNGPLTYDTPSSGSVFVGKNLIQIHIAGGKTITEYRIYNDLTNGIEVQTFVDSIDVSDGVGKEIVMIVNAPSINNNNTCYTDSMGMEMQERILNYRATWNLQVNEPVSGNYYPVQSTIYIQDTQSSELLAIIPDRSQGGASIHNGQIELMIHRRVLYDANVNLNETDYDGKGMRQWFTHTILFAKPGFITTSYRQIQLNRDIENLVLLAPSAKSTSFEISPVETSNFGNFDPYVKLLSRPMALNKFLLRFHNMDESTTRNVSTSVFSNAAGAGTVVEMSLTANQAKSQMIHNRYDWNGLGLNDPKFINNDYLKTNQFSLRPLEIRAFVVTFSAEEIPEKWEDILYV